MVHLWEKQGLPSIKPLKTSARRMGTTDPIRCEYSRRSRGRTRMTSELLPFR